jgi:hypothetical protein
LRLAKDHFSYIGIHREALDEIQQLKNELWKIILNSKSGYSGKTAAVKELHNLVKTKVLLLRELPFIMNLSKYYDLSKFDNSLPNKSSLSYAHALKNNYNQNSAIGHYNNRKDEKDSHIYITMEDDFSESI